MSDCWIQTRSGLAFDLLEPKPDQVCLADIAWSLGRLSRYTGHGLRHCSVAEHSVRGADIAERKYGRATAWDFLMHDAGETYTGDISRPMKLAIRAMYDRYVKPYLVVPGDPLEMIEALINETVGEKYCVVHGRRVKEIDTADLSVEMLANLSTPPPRMWAFDVEALGHKSLSEDPNLWIDLHGQLSPIDATSVWLCKAAELAPSDEIREEAIEALTQVSAWDEQAQEGPPDYEIPAP